MTIRPGYSPGCARELDALERPQAAGCGRVERTRDDGPLEREGEVACLLDAVDAGQRGELVYVEFSVEGDPITHYLRVLGRDDV